MSKQYNSQANTSKANKDRSGNDKVIIEGQLIPTPSVKANLYKFPDVDTGEVKQEWIPNSQVFKTVIQHLGEGEEAHTLTVPRWLAEAKGVAYMEESEVEEEGESTEEELDFDPDISEAPDNFAPDALFNYGTVDTPKR